tara:strand:- start:574 stop:807 length:234 start_codon:yes stop_codon:yes gene_type:complete
MTTKTNKKPAVKINSGNLDLNAVYTATGKVARATHNADRHVTLNGKTVREALQSRLVNAADIKYDLKKGFITLLPAK